MAYLNDKNSKTVVDWSSARNNTDRLRHRPHVVNTANNRYDTQTRYYSSIDADLYFGDIFIDEVTNLTWQVQQNAMPIFGYNSYTFDALATGSRIIQGQFAVNFTKANYLTEVIKTMKTISRVTYGPDTPAQCKVYTDADNIRRHTPKWDAGFDIVIGYGELKSNNEYETYMILDCCQITGCGQSLDYNGEPVQEIYTFTARDIKYTTLNVSGNSELNSPNIEEVIIESGGNNVLLINESSLDFTNGKGEIRIKYTIKDKYNVTETFLSFPDIPDLRTNMMLSVNSDTMLIALQGEEKETILKYINDNGLSKVKAEFSAQTYPETNSSDQSQFNQTLMISVSK